jgi:hypothetical protein
MIKNARKRQTVCVCVCVCVCIKELYFAKSEISMISYLNTVGTRLLSIRYELLIFPLYAITPYQMLLPKYHGDDN